MPKATKTLASRSNKSPTKAQRILKLTDEVRAALRNLRRIHGLPVEMRHTDRPVLQPGETTKAIMFVGLKQQVEGPSHVEFPNLGRFTWPVSVLQALPNCTNRTFQIWKNNKLLRFTWESRTIPREFLEADENLLSSLRRRGELFPRRAPAAAAPKPSTPPRQVASQASVNDDEYNSDDVEIVAVHMSDVDGISDADDGFEMSDMVSSSQCAPGFGSSDDGLDELESDQYKLSSPTKALKDRASVIEAAAVTVIVAMEVHGCTCFLCSRI